MNKFLLISLTVSLCAFVAVAQAVTYTKTNEGEVYSDWYPNEDDGHAYNVVATYFIQGPNQGKYLIERYRQGDTEPRHTSENKEIFDNLKRIFLRNMLASLQTAYQSSLYSHISR